MEHAIVIPSLNPGRELISLAEELISRGAGKIVIVNDGSGPDYEHIFRRLKGYGNIFILEHETNLGKGEALKTAFTFCLEHFKDITGLITADADGQHTPDDIFKVSRALSADSESLILGVREFEKSTTPLRSYIGNRTTSMIFNFLYRIKLSDTQTGLRGIPASELEWMAKIRGQRYDYELNMLIEAKRRNMKMKQIAIDVLYFNNNRGSHFKMVMDTVCIAKMMVFNLLKKDKARFYGRLFYFCRGILRLFGKKLTVVGKLPKGQAVFVGHHQNLKGALNTMVWINNPVRLWVLSVFCDKESCYDQYAGYTFSRRRGYPKALAKIAAYIPSRFIPLLMKSMRAIPVYRNSFKAMKVTVSRSAEALRYGENILIFPDIDYASESERMGEMYTGFIHLDRYYYAETGKHIAFVPVRVNLAKRIISFGKPSYIKDGEHFLTGKKRIAEELRQQMNSLEYA